MLQAYFQHLQSQTTTTGHTIKDRKTTSQTRWGGKRLQGSRTGGDEGSSPGHPSAKEGAGSWVTRWEDPESFFP